MNLEFHGRGDLWGGWEPFTWEKMFEVCKSKKCLIILENESELEFMTGLQFMFGCELEFSLDTTLNERKIWYTLMGKYDVIFASYDPSDRNRI